MKRKIEGELRFQKSLDKKHVDYLYAFYSTRRVSRNIFDFENFPDPLRMAVGLPIGKDCEFYVGKVKKINSIEDWDSPPKNQPSVWCPFKPSEDGQFLIFDSEPQNILGRLFNLHHSNELDIVNEWLVYIISNFITPWGYSLNGKLKIIYNQHSSTTFEKEIFVRTISVKDNCASFSNLDVFK